MKSIKVCEYSRSRSFHYDLILQDQASGERSQDQWSSGLPFLMNNDHSAYSDINLKLSIYSFNILYSVDVTGILRMYMKDYNAEKISLTNFRHV